MRRVGNFLLRNWPLKLGAILLATVLYSGLVLAQNVRTWTGEVPVETIRPPSGATLLSALEPVTLIRYRAPLDVGVLSPDSFSATVDLSDVEVTPGGEAQSVSVRVIAVDRRVQVVDWQPRELEVRLDPIEVREMPITVTLGSVPEGLNVGPPQTEPSSATVSGASSRVASVSALVARVSIDGSAINVDRDFELVAVDAAGNQVPNVEIDPPRARVRIAVARELANRSLPVVPELTGEPALGYRVTSVSVEPLVVTVSGEESTVTRVENAPTEPIDVSGRTNDLEAVVGLALPEGVSVTGSDQVRVVLTISEESGSQTFRAGVTLTGADARHTYEIGAEQVAVTLGGPLTALSALDAGSLIAVADVSRLTPGEHTVPLSVAAPAGFDVLAISPDEVVITVTAIPELTSPESAAPAATPVGLIGRDGS